MLNALLTMLYKPVLANLLKFSRKLQMTSKAQKMTTLPNEINETDTECVDVFSDIYSYAQDYSAEKNQHYKVEDLALEVV